MIGFIVGTVLGGTVGFFTFCLCDAVKYADKITNSYNEQSEVTVFVQNDTIKYTICYIQEKI